MRVEDIETEASVSHTRDGEGFRNEPPIDFAQSGAREAFQKALSEVQRQFPIHAQLIIDHERNETSETLAVASPNDESVKVGVSACADVEAARRAIQAAREAFPDWSATAASERAGFMRRLADRCHEERYRLAALEVHEAGKPWREADGDVCEAIDFIRYYAEEALRLSEPTLMQPDLLGERNELTYAPLGVVGVIGPWNFPLAIPTGMMAAALAAGNTVVWKPAEQTPLVVFRMMELMLECALPKGVVNYLPGRGEVAGHELTVSPDVSMIAFTGSREVGTAIASACRAPHPRQSFIKRVVTEMGGKNGIIIDDSADLDEAVPAILDSAYGYSGQKCSACSRLIVLESRYDELCERLREGIASLKVAPATDPGCEVGPLIDRQAQAKVREYLEIAAQEGKVIYTGEVGALDSQGPYVAPAAFFTSDPHSRIAQEEIFGPILTVMTVPDFERALEMANDTAYGLTGGVFSRTPSHLNEARRRFQCGNLYLNRGITGSIVGRQPFGGFKMSGIGSKAGGPDYVKQFMVSRTITENIMRHGAAPLKRS